MTTRLHSPSDRPFCVHKVRAVALLASQSGARSIVWPGQSSPVAIGERFVSATRGTRVFPGILSTTPLETPEFLGKFAAQTPISYQSVT
jgi:hypothetical protein